MRTFIGLAIVLLIPLVLMADSIDVPPEVDPEDWFTITKNFGVALSDKVAPNQRIHILGDQPDEELMKKHDELFKKRAGTAVATYYLRKDDIWYELKHEHGRPPVTFEHLAAR